tara:strand:- start:2 stop:535 length:534 start_codon:yes stop_codon:yes gene_type:complete
LNGVKMAEYINEEPCEFIYNVTTVEKVIDGDTIDAVIDLGFDVRFCGRVRLLGIDTPESRTRHKNEKVYGKLSKWALSSWVHWAIMDDRDDIEMQLRCPEADSRGKFGRILGEIWVNCTQDGHKFNGWTNVNKWMCESGYAVGYSGQNKDDVKGEHWKNRLYLEEQGIQNLLEWDED